MPSIADLERMLRAAQLRVTRPRVAVLTAVHQHPHADTDSIISSVRADYGEVSHQAVYDVLRALTTAGLIRRIEPAGSPARYEARVGDNHHHVVCRSCGTIADVDCAVGDTPCLIASNDQGFLIDEAEVVYWGLCSRCVAASSGAAAPDRTTAFDRTTAPEGPTAPNETTASEGPPAFDRTTAPDGVPAPDDTFRP